MRHRWEMINHCAKTIGCKRYLEIGCWHDECFSKIDVQLKTGVDPHQGGTHRMTSDAFFESCEDTFDLVFIDGLHLAEQVVRDIYNSILHLSRGGMMILHDCNPPQEYMQHEVQTNPMWTGNVWKAFVHARTLTGLDCCCADMDMGLGMIRFGKVEPLELGVHPLSLGWEDLRENRVGLLNLKSPEDAARWAGRFRML